MQWPCDTEILTVSRPAQGAVGREAPRLSTVGQRDSAQESISEYSRVMKLKPLGRPGAYAWATRPTATRRLARRSQSAPRPPSHRARQCCRWSYGTASISPCDSSHQALKIDLAIKTKRLAGHYELIAAYSRRADGWQPVPPRRFGQNAQTRPCALTLLPSPPSGTRLTPGTSANPTHPSTSPVTLPPSADRYRPNPGSGPAARRRWCRTHGPDTSPTPSSRRPPHALHCRHPRVNRHDRPAAARLQRRVGQAPPTRVRGPQKSRQRPVSPCWSASATTVHIRRYRRVSRPCSALSGAHQARVIETGRVAITDDAGFSCGRLRQQPKPRLSFAGAGAPTPATCRAPPSRYCRRRMPPLRARQRTTFVGVLRLQPGTAEETWLPVWHARRTRPVAEPAIPRGQSDHASR